MHALARDVPHGQVRQPHGHDQPCAAPAQLGGYGPLEWEPAASEIFIATELRAAGYATAALGKWQIHRPLASDQYDFVRQLGGFDHYAGWPWAMDDNATGVNSTETPQGYIYSASSGSDGWPRIVDNVLDNAGAPAPGSLINVPERALDWCANYLPTQTVDDALAWIATAQEPWFCFVAPQTPHTPLQAPPPELYTSELPEITYLIGHPSEGEPVLVGTNFLDLAREHPDTAEVLPFCRAAVRSTSRELGRMFAALPAGTTVVIFSDNGTVSVPGADGDIVQPPFDPAKSKGTLYEGGTRVPLIIAGAGVQEPGTTSGALVHLLMIRVGGDPGREFYRVSDAAGGDVDAHETQDLLDPGQVMTAEEQQNYLLLRHEIDDYIRNVEHPPGLGFPLRPHVIGSISFE